MAHNSYFRLQFIIFALVSASFTNIYITQPVLPVLQSEFAVDMGVVSLSVSAVILGIALANLPFGVLADKLSIRPIIFAGGIMVAAGGVVCALTKDFWILIAARFFQGIFIPALTTCLAAYLAKTLPSERLNVVMGSYVSATVLGGLGGRLLGGWLHPPLHWRYAFLSASAIILIATCIALWGLPRSSTKIRPGENPIGFLELIKKWELVRIYFCAASSFAVFSSIFNYLPFRLDAPPFGFSTQMITFLYVVYIVGIFIGPAAGKISNRFGSGATLIGGTVVLGASLMLLLLPSVAFVVLGLLGVCAGFFSVHAAAVGSLNRKLSSGQGRANALYVLFYYLGGWVGISCSGFLFAQNGWSAVIYFCGSLLLIPFITGLGERKT
jgi:MFS transporter, YNFM family, putative membrane transport protein